MSLTITSANSVFTLAVPDVFSVPQIMQQYAVDDAFETENVAPTENLMGVDGFMSSGFTPYITPLSFMLQANSLSITNTMDVWLGAMQQARESLPANATIVIPSLYKIWTFTNGALKGAMVLPPAKKVLQPQKYLIEWQTVVVGPYSSAAFG